ncbi:unnamed protein product [Caenorhabditis brenneri]
MLSNLLCCFRSTQTVPIVPFFPNQPIPFSAPPRPGFQVAPVPPEGKGPSIVYENDLVRDEMPSGFHVSDLSGSHPE